MVWLFELGQLSCENNCLLHQARAFYFSRGRQEFSLRKTCHPLEQFWNLFFGVFAVMRRPDIEGNTDLYLHGLFSLNDLLLALQDCFGE